MKKQIETLKQENKNSNEKLVEKTHQLSDANMKILSLISDIKEMKKSYLTRVNKVIKTPKSSSRNVSKTK